MSNIHRATSITLLVLAACGGPEFTMAPTSDALVFGDSGIPVADGGGANGDSDGTAGDVDASSSDGQQQHDAGSDADAEAATDGSEHDAGHDAASGSDAGGTLDAGVDSGCTYVHSDGVGQSWTDCTPLDESWASGTEVYSACEAYAVSAGYPASWCRLADMCSAPGAPQTAVVCPWSGGGAPLSSACEGYCWAAGPSAVYGVVYECPSNGALATSCTQTSTWK
jgi:hypothetical protein